MKMKARLYRLHWLAQLARSPRRAAVSQRWNLEQLTKRDETYPVKIQSGKVRKSTDRNTGSRRLRTRQRAAKRALLDKEVWANTGACLAQKVATRA